MDTTRTRETRENGGGGVDPVLCCAARICCDASQSRQATMNLLQSMGLSPVDADSVARQMDRRGIVFSSAGLSDAIRELIGEESYRLRRGDADGDMGSDSDVVAAVEP